MWEYPGGKVETDEELDACLRRELREELGIESSIGEKLGVFRHAYTHFRVTLHAFYCHITNCTPVALTADEIQWVELTKLGEYPMGKLDRMITNSILDSASITNS